MTNILIRCAAAFSERYELLGPFDDNWIELCTAAALEHLAHELIVLNQRDPRLTVHQLAALLRDEAAAAMPEPIEPHPSLTPAQRNPNLR